MEKIEKEEKKQDLIKETGQVIMEGKDNRHKIHLMTIIGEIEGHDILGQSSKPPSMNIFCRNWHPLRTAGKSAAFFSCSIPWAVMWKQDLPLQR